MYPPTPAAALHEAERPVSPLTGGADGAGLSLYREETEAHIKLKD